MGSYTFGEIQDNVNVVNSGHDAKDGERILIAETLLKIDDEEVIEKIMENTTFIYSDCPGFIEKSVSIDSRPSIIVLNFSEMTNGEEKDSIAHEIAHVILEHYKSRLSDGKIEREADDLIVGWGFKRRYTEEDYKRLEA